MEHNLDQHLSSPPTLELGEFLDGVLFSPDDTILVPDETIVVQGDDSDLANTTINSSTMVNLREEKSTEPLRSQTAMTRSLESESLFVPSSDVNFEKDIFCLRGQGGANYTGNQIFRRLISSNKRHFDKLTKEEQEKFSVSLWLSLRDKGHRFLRSNERDYEALDYDKSVRKCNHALISCRTGIKEKRIVDVDEATQDPSQQLSVKKQKQEISEKLFDNTAMESINSLLTRRELTDAMSAHWGSEDETRKELLKDQLLRRYRAAALNGLSVDQFSGCLLSVLLKEVDGGAKEFRLAKSE
jgi:hypothetical protein